MNTKAGFTAHKENDGYIFVFIFFMGFVIKFTAS